MRSSRFESPPVPASAALALVALLSVLSLAATSALAQDEGEPLPASEHPGSDSPESVSAGAARHAAGRRRAQAFLIPLDEKARAPTGRVAQALERALAAAHQYEVVDLAKALASDAEPLQEQKAAEGRKLVAEAGQSFAAHAYAEAVAKYKLALRALTPGLAAVEPHEIAELFLRLAAAEQLTGESKEIKSARDAYVTAALLDPQLKLQAASVDPIAEQPLLLARNDLEQIPIGKLELETRPTGARVIIDGQPQGSTPTRVELTGGKHLLRLERTGFYPTAELIDVASRRETLYSVTLNATPGAATLNQLIAGAADEASHGRAGEKAQALASRFRLDRLLVGSIASHGVKVSLLLALADPTSGALLGRQELLLTADGTDSDQLEFEAQEAARKLFLVDDSGHAAALPAPLPDAPADDSPRRAVMPGAASAAPAAPAESAPSADDPGLVGRERRPVAPLAPLAPAPAGPAPSSDRPAAVGESPDTSAAPAPDQPASANASDEKKKKKKDKKKDLHTKSGTESWDSN
jgi:hypothetical protein